MCLLGVTYAGDDLGAYAGYEVGAVGVAFSTSTSCLALPPDGCLSAGGDTKLDTGTLSYEHFNDIEKSQSLSLDLNLNAGLFTGERSLFDQDGGLPGEWGKPSNKKTGTNVALEGTYDLIDRAQSVKATVGQGTITIRNQEDQTQDLANLNRDPSLSQIITKDVQGHLEIYVSDSAIKGVVDGLRAAFDYLDRLVGLGQITQSGSDKLKEVLAKLDEVDPESLALCDGRQGFNLWRLFVGTAHAAAGDGCVLRFYGGNALNLTPEEKAALRQSIVEGATDAIRKLVPTIRDLEQREAAGTLNAAGQQRLARARQELQAHMSYFELCNDDPGDLRASGLGAGVAQYDRYLSLAETYRLGGDAVANKFAEMSRYSAEQWQELKRRAPQLYRAAYHTLYAHDGNTVDAMYLLGGLSVNGTLSPRERQDAINAAYGRLSGAIFPNNISGLNTARRMTVLSAMQNVLSDVSLSDRKAFARLVLEGAKAREQSIAGSVERAQVLTAVIMGGAAFAEALPGILACVENPACLTEASIAIGEALGGDAFAGTTLGAWITAAATKADEVVAKLRGLVARSSVKLPSAVIRDPVWELDPLMRGKVIEGQLAVTEYKDWWYVGAENNGFWPLVDFSKGQTAVSLKTVDTNGSQWFKKVVDHIIDLGNRRITIGDKPANLVLDLRVQPGGLGDAQSLVEIGTDSNVTVIIKEF